VDDIWGTENRTFLLWDKAQEKFNLTPIAAGNWNMLTNKILGQWRHLLEADPDITHPKQWIGF
jgi:hypothetical protein